MNFINWLQKSFDFASMKLKSGIGFDVETNVTDLTFMSDPWNYFNVFGFTPILTSFAEMEVTMYPDAKYNILRESVVNRPGVGPAAFRTVIETQIVRNNNTNTITQDSTRERDRGIICLTPIIWFASHIIAFDPQARSLFTRTVLGYDHMPVLTAELMKRTRECSNGFYNWTIGLYIGGWTALVAVQPNLAGTFYDPNFLRTQGGMDVFCNFCQYLGNRGDSNYIKMVKPTKSEIPPRNSGFMVTGNAFSVERGHDFLRSTVFITACSLSDPNFVYSADAICGTYFYQNSFGQEYFGHQFTSFRLRGRSTSLQWVEHVILRVTGEQPNKSPKNERDHTIDLDTSPKPNGKGSKPNRSSSPDSEIDPGIRTGNLKFSKDITRIIKREIRGILTDLGIVFKNQKFKGNSSFTTKSA